MTKIEQFSSLDRRTDDSVPSVSAHTYNDTLDTEAQRNAYKNTIMLLMQNIESED